MAVQFYYHPQRRLPQWQRTMNQMINDMQRFNDLSPVARNRAGSLGTAPPQRKTSWQMVGHDHHKFEVSIDVSHFKPEELDVHLDGRILSVEGKQEMEGDDEYVLRSFKRKWVLPDDIKSSDLRTSLSPSGLLTIEAPLRESETGGPVKIPIVPGPHREPLQQNLDDEGPNTGYCTPS